MKFMVRGLPRLIGSHEIYSLVALVRKFCSLWEHASAATLGNSQRYTRALGNAKVHGKLVQMKYYPEWKRKHKRALV